MLVTQYNTTIRLHSSIKNYILYYKEVIKGGKPE